MADNVLDEFLVHYGVKGMKWGVRKDRYISERKESRKEKRNKEAEGYEKEVKEYQKRIDALKKSGNKGDQSDIKWLEDRRDESAINAKKTREGGLTPAEKRLLKGAAVAVGVIALYGGYRMVQSGSMNQSIMKGKAFLEQRGDIPFNVKDILSSKELTESQIQDLVVSKINPDFGAIGTKMNCRRATFAYELRRRGYDVTATRTTTAFGQNAAGLHNALDTEGRDIGTGHIAVVTRLLTEQARKSIDSSSHTPILDSVKKFPAGAREKASVIGKGQVDGIFESIKAYPDGARGEVGVIWGSGGGHSMAWEKVKGVPIIFDAQTRKTYKPGSKEWTDIFENISQAGVTRLDNVELDLNYLLRWVKDA